MRANSTHNILSLSKLRSNDGDIISISNGLPTFTFFNFHIHQKQFAMKKFLFFIVAVFGFGVLVAQSPADASSFSAEKVVNKESSFVLTFHQLNDDVVNAINELQSTTDGARQLFTSVSADPANNTVTVKLANDKMSQLDLTNYLKGYLPQALSRSTSNMSVE